MRAGCQGGGSDSAWGLVMLLAASMLASSAAAHPAGFGEYSGAQLYQRFCASCHGPGGRGDGPVADALAVMVPDLTEIARRSGGEFPRQRIMRTIDGREHLRAHGERSMPVWGFEFWAEEGGDEQARARSRDMIERLTDYLQSLQLPPE